jgi:hypothetical protein
MKFSEAMRLGAMQGPQVYGKLYALATPGSSCAMGAVLIACGNPYPLPRALREATSVPIKACPIGNCPTGPEFFVYNDGLITNPTVWGMVVHLNNIHRWTREQIADYIANNGYDAEVWEEPVVKTKEEVLV